MPNFSNLDPDEPSAQNAQPSAGEAPTSDSSPNVLQGYRLGKDEMNLVEHPFALLKRNATNDVIISLSWEKIHPRTGKTVQASWRVAGDPELGLPGPVEERLYLVLMELSREQGFPQRVVFSRHDVLTRLGLAKNSKSYTLIHEAFLRLKNVNIDAKRSFWNAAVQNFSASVMFSILDEVTMVDETPGRRKGQLPMALSSFKWSDVMYASLVAGNIRSLSIQFTLSLDLPLSARLFRYLDKHRTAGATSNKTKFEIELHRLCEIHLGMAPSRYASKLKERLLPALEELKTRGFLLDWAYEPMRTSPEQIKAVFFFSNAPLDSLPRTGEEADTAPAVPTPPDDGAHETNSPPQETAVESQGASSMGDALPALAGLAAQIEWTHGSWAEDESARLDAACDRVFKALPENEQARILERARESLPPFLRDKLSLPGARLGVDKERRALVWCGHKEAVYAALRTLDEPLPRA